MSHVSQIQTSVLKQLNDFNDLEYDMTQLVMLLCPSELKTSVDDLKPTQWGEKSLNLNPR